MPLAFYSIFAVVLPTSNESASYLLATYGIFAVMGPALFGFGVGVAREREQGWLELKRASPVPAWVYITAKILTTLIFSSLAVLPIYLMAGFVAGIEFSRDVWVALFFVHISATIPFVILGLVLGLSFASNAAVAITNIIFLGLAMLGGLWFPVFLFPKLMQLIAYITPTYHLAEIALGVLGEQGRVVRLSNVIVILIMSITLVFLAVLAWKKQR
jgi:ABC-2 type transport system permease protein